MMTSLHHSDHPRHAPPPPSSASPSGGGSRGAWGAVARRLVVTLLPLAAACASSTQAGDGAGAQARYPRRRAGCELAVYHTPVPAVAQWDDLGVAEVTCRTDDAVAECLRRLQAEACQMGGDLLYNVPRQPARPREQLMIYRGQVAHSRAGAPTRAPDADLPPPASPEEAAGPVVPLPSGAAP